MVAKVFCILLFTVLCESKKSLVPQAILQLVRSNYGDSSNVIEVFYNSRKVKILDKTLKLLSSEKKLKITPIDMKDLSPFDEFYCITDCDGECVEAFLKDAFFIFDTLENYREFKANLYFSFRYNLELNHLVYCEDAREKNIQEIITRDTYESFLLVKNYQISLHTMSRFTEKKCSTEQLVEINQFSSLERKWKTAKFFMPRIENFHGCELKIGFSSFRKDGLPFVRALKKKDGTETVEGALIDMCDALSTHLNFTAIYTKAWLGSNISTYDFTMGADALRLVSRSDSPSSDPIFTSSDVFLVPPGERYTSWEKLLLPFDWQTWVWLGVIFAVAFFVIFLIKVSKSTSLYEFVIGSNVTVPSLNVVAIFMGTGQTLLPQKNVARFMVMCFILFSLIMRTAYQGKYFEFLTSDVRRKPMQTIEELKDNDFTAIVSQPNCYDDCKDDLKEQG